MSAIAATAPALAPLTRPGLGRLTRVELRKMVDTRAGFWLLFTVGALTVIAVILLMLVGNAEDHDLRDMLSVAVAPSSILLPVVGILLVSSEWSQRTALITFTLVPHRPRVLGAKLAAAVVLSIVALVFCLVIAVLGTAISAPGLAHSWSLPVGFLFQVALFLVTSLITGVAFGALFLSSAPAIVLSFVLPLGWAALGSIRWFNDAAQWLDTTRTTAHMAERTLSGDEWAKFGTSMALWLVLPLAIGLFRIAKGEIRAA